MSVNLSVLEAGYTRVPAKSDLLKPGALLPPKPVEYQVQALLDGKDDTMSIEEKTQRLNDLLDRSAGPERSSGMEN